MRLELEVARALFGAEPVVRLATVSGSAEPHLVPVTVALLGDRIVFAIDAKPKSSSRLRRLDNIRANPAVCFLADHYQDDWTGLWWVRADATARIVAGGSDFELAIGALAGRYDQYRRQPPGGPAVIATVRRWTGWSAGALPAAALPAGAGNRPDRPDRPETAADRLG